MILDFSIVLMYLLHTIQQNVIEEMNIREVVVFGQLKNSKNTMTSLKNKVKDIELKEKTQQDDKERLENVFVITWSDFSNA